MILVLTRPGDDHADFVCNLLSQRAVAFRRFDPTDFPSEAAMTIAFTSDGYRRSRIETTKGPLELDEVAVIWRRRPGTPVADARITDPAVRGLVELESSRFVDDLWETIGCPFVPGSHATIQRAQHKARQLRIAGELGFELPPTRFTNDPDELLDFYRTHDGAVVTKAVCDGDLEAPDEYFGRYTERVTKRDLGHVRALRFCPVIVQAYVPKRVELRVTVVGERVFTAEIHSQASNHTKHDWRRYDSGRTPYFVHKLPDEIAARCFNLVERLGLCYGAIDLILTPDGRYVFLEINPNGQFAWIEHETGLPIASAMADLLVSRMENRAPIATGGATR